MSEQVRYSPVPAGAVAGRVLLHDRRDLEQTELVQHHELSRRHADHLQSLAVQARAVRLDEAVPANAVPTPVATKQHAAREHRARQHTARSRTELQVLEAGDSQSQIEI